VGGDGRRARYGPQQGDLPDSLTTPAPPHETPILEDVQLSRSDRIVRIPPLALPDEDGPGRQLDRSEGGGEAFKGGGAVAAIAAACTR
jgi:hypothetical protein